MAKKKQFAGKKTKLAKLPLTQALASQVESGRLAPAPSPPPASSLKQISHPWDEATTGSGEPLGAAFVFLIRELTDLSSQLQLSPNPALTNQHIFLPKRIPGRIGLLHALREARENLRDLQGLLSRP